jgi:hypothetical protein
MRVNIINKIILIFIIMFPATKLRGIKDNKKLRKPDLVI